jgi:nickel transport protein
MKRFVLAILLLVTANLRAEAHLLKVFATVEDGSITGYAFFVGGGRPQKALLIVQDNSGREIYRSNTDDSGGFNWHPPKLQTMTVIVNAGDGHVAQSTLDVDRFDPNASEAMPLPVGTLGEVKSNPAASEEPACSSSAEIGVIVDRSVDRAVSRQVRPLLEAFADADSRIRFNDIIGGIGMIFGLAGVAMWMSARRSTNQGRSTDDNKINTEARA